MLSIYSIIHVKTFASSPRNISKGQYSKIAWTILDFELIRYESKIHYYIKVWQCDVLKNKKTINALRRTLGFVSALPPIDSVNLGNVMSLVLS